MLNVNLSHPNARPTIVVGSSSGVVASGPAKKQPMPGAVINISPGHTEYIQLITLGRGWYYEWSIQLQVVISQRTELFTFGTAKHPLTTWLGALPSLGYDYSATKHGWKEYDANSPSTGPA
jgi:hypothetical protein